MWCSIKKIKQPKIYVPLMKSKCKIQHSQKKTPWYMYMVCCIRFHQKVMESVKLLLLAIITFSFLLEYKYMQFSILIINRAPAQPRAQPRGHNPPRPRAPLSPESQRRALEQEKKSRQFQEQQQRLKNFSKGASRVDADSLIESMFGKAEKPAPRSTVPSAGANAGSQNDEPFHFAPALSAFIFQKIFLNIRGYPATSQKTCNLDKKETANNIIKL